MDELTLAVVGIDYPNEDKTGSSRRMELTFCAPGDPMELRPEPKNEHDEHAVAVFSARGVQVGYLTAERAPFIGGRMKRGEDVLAVFQGIEGGAGYIRARFGGEPPTLPARPAAVMPPPAPAPLRPRPEPRRVIDPDAFYPDEDGPEWDA